MADDELPELQNSETVGTVTFTQGAWWDEHSDVFDEVVARGEIPCIRIGKRILVPIAGLNRLLESAGLAMEPEA